MIFGSRLESYGRSIINNLVNYEMKVAIIGQFWNSIVRRTRSNRREKKKGREGEEIRGSG